MPHRRISWLAILVLMSASACSRAGVEVYAPPEFAEGSIVVDGAAVATLSKPLHNYRWRGWTMAKDEFSGPPRHETTATVLTLAQGEHDIILIKHGYKSLFTRIRYEPGQRTIIDLSGAIVQRTPNNPGHPGI